METINAFVHDRFKEFKLLSYDEFELLRNGEIVINCTPCEMYTNINNSPISAGNIAKFQTTVDLLYNPKETVFLKYA